MRAFTVTHEGDINVIKNILSRVMQLAVERQQVSGLSICTNHPGVKLKALGI
jgi:hypothetical protein